MAIERALSREQNENRAELPAAYTKAHDVEFRLSGRDGGQVWVHVYTFADAEARKDPQALCMNKETVKCSLADFARIGAPTGWTADEIKAAAYRFLKSLPGVDPKPDPVNPKTDLPARFAGKDV